MPKYKVITKCFWGKKWNIGEVVETEFIPPHHFKRVSDNEEVTTVISVIKADELKSKGSKDIISYAQANKEVNAIPKSGFASSLAIEQPLTSFKDMKKK